MGTKSSGQLKLAPAKGNLPALQYLLPQQLSIDRAYQRSVESAPSRALIRKIAQRWNWDLCQPLVVARREDGSLYVIDGQHRLEAARLRGDIAQLPAVVVSYASAADEAASFVELNRQRAALQKLDLFRASIAGGDAEACAIMAAIEDVGLSLAPHSNHTAWKPGMVSNIGGIEQAWRSRGPAVTRAALRCLSEAFRGEILRYAGTIFPGVAAVCADELSDRSRNHLLRFEKFQTALCLRSQEQWRIEISRYKGEHPDVKFAHASEAVVRAAWARASAETAPVKSVAVVKAAPVRPRSPAPAAIAGKAWCDQCDAQVTPAEAAGCNSRFCAVRKAG